MIITDFLVIGGGIIGINIATELRNLFPDTKVTLIEKGKECGAHASTRNSGVLHAGFYYSPDSLKAKFTRIGNKLLTEYCDSNRIPVNKCGKLVVAKDPSEHVYLDELLKRGRTNDIPLEDITEDEAVSIEPMAKTSQRAIFSPTTSSVDPHKVMQSMVRDAVNKGVEVHRGVCFIRKTTQGILTSSGMFQAAYIVNTAGLYADSVARKFGFSSKYRILPFKGLYLYSNEPTGFIRTNIYPVPDLRNPFLGVHFTVTVDGKTKIGPTAIPALWRENYHGFDGYNFRELVDIFIREACLFASSDFNFKKLAIEEIKKYSRSRMVFLASLLAKRVKTENYKTWGKPGIRAQLVDIKARKLEMDFVIEGDDKSIHVLNAVSPGFTCSIPFSRYVCREIQSQLN
ncbi:MAG: L-2-hydroxyglutarate oxidase [Deltaproteobacteria bacterium]|nr:L-2-hydroxyglutarate oxidase [Deltaproteobacteria bacterium]